METLIGYPLLDALKVLEKYKKIINIKKVTGSNRKFNDLNKPYVIRQHSDDGRVTLYVTYY